MITPALEKLILQGKAFFRTAVIGGTNKATLNIDDDRFIIITDLTYFPGLYTKVPKQLINYDNVVSQFTVYGNRGFNNFVARTSYDFYTNTVPGTSFYSPKTIVKFDTYILHEQQVGFSFSKGSAITKVFQGPAFPDNPGYKAPQDYGREGDIPYLNSLLEGKFNTLINRHLYPLSKLRSGQNNVNNLLFPIDKTTQLEFIDGLGGDIETNQYPILHVSYVEILGNPNNIQI